MACLDSISAGKYILLTTFRRDGTAVPTPVWFVRQGDVLLITTDGTSGKVKRLRANPRVTIAPCDMRGRPKGDGVEAIAELVDADQTEEITAAVARRYGLLGRLMTRRGSATRQGIRVRMSQGVPAAQQAMT